MATPYSEDERQQLVSIFESLDVKPKMDNADDLKNWMADYVKDQGRMANPGDQLATGTVPKVPIDTTTHVIHDPKISIFSGGSNPKEITYEAWRYEVMTLLQEGTHKLNDVTTAAKKSLRGDASKVVRRLGIHADMHMIRKKLDGIYGTVEDTEDLLGKFYSTQQQSDESVASWGCRLEDLLDRALHDHPLPTQSMNDMLRTKFWNGLLPHLREPMRNKAEVIVNFDDLLIAARKIENEHPNIITAKQNKDSEKSKRPQVKMVSAEMNTPPTSDMETLKGLVCSLTTKVDELQQNFNSKVSTAKPKYSGNRQQRQQWSKHNSGESSFDKGSGKRPPITCYRCGQVGHLKHGCRVELTDEMIQSLNSNGSTATGYR